MRSQITPAIKSAVIHYHSQIKNKTLTQKRVAYLCGISERSVKRILDEAGLATAVPLLKGEAHKAVQLMKKFNTDVRGLEQALLFQQAAMLSPRSTRAQMVKAISEMSEEEYLPFLNKVVTARVANSHNVGVSTAMLNIMNAVDKNAKS